MEVINQIPAWFWFVAVVTLASLAKAAWWVVQQIHYIKINYATEKSVKEQVDILHRVNNTMAENIKADNREMRDELRHLAHNKQDKQ